MTTPPPSAAPQVKSAAKLRLLRGAALVAWISLALLIGLLWGQFRAGVLHPAYPPFFFFLLLLVLSTLVSFFLGIWRVAFGPRRAAAALWGYAGVLPALLALALIGRGLSEWRSGQVGPTFAFTVLATAGFSVGQAQAEYTYPHRLEGKSLVMYYGDGVTDPEADLDAMERHVADLQRLTGRRLRAKIHWVRGSLLGVEQLSLFGVALGSTESPASDLDRHELAHAVLFQGNEPDTEPPMLLAEGWAESQSQDRKALADSALMCRDFIRDLGQMSEADRETGLRRTVRPDDFRQLALQDRQEGKSMSYLRALTDPYWYHHDNGPVYSVGGAFVDYLIHTYGMAPFLDFYYACRPGTFAYECQRIYGCTVEVLEKEFWDNVEEMTRKDPKAK